MTRSKSLFKMTVRIVSYLFLTLLISIFYIGCNKQSSEEISKVIPDLGDYNLIMISLDTLRQDRLGLYGYSLPISPGLDRLSQRSFVMTDVSAQSSNTLTSHRAMFTSRYIYGFEGDKPLRESTLAGRMSSGGWHTAAFVDGGKMHHTYGNDAGFDYYDDQGGGFESILPKAQTWLKTNLDQKFFLFLHTYDIHAPYNPSDPFEKIFTGDYVPVRKFSDKVPRYLNTQHLSRNEFGYLSSLYDGGIRECDAVFEKFLILLRHLELHRNTVILIVSDHGESLGEREYVGHHLLYNVQLKVPMSIYLPGCSGKIIPGVIETIDIFPTLSKLFGLNVKSGMQGQDITPQLFQHKPPFEKRFHISEVNSRAILAGDNWKLILRESPEKDELYFLDTDPEEIDNRITLVPHHAERLRSAFTRQTEIPLDQLRIQRNDAILIDPSKSSDDDLKYQLETLGYIDP